MSADLFRPPSTFSSPTTPTSSSTTLQTTANTTTTSTVSSMTMVTSNPDQQHQISRIPLPSPTPFRRCHSLRMRGEHNITKTPPNGAATKLNLTLNVGDSGVDKGSSLLPNGGSNTNGCVTNSGYNTARSRRLANFDRKCNGVQKNDCAGNRARSLSLSLSNSRLSTSTSRISSSPRTPPTSPDALRHNSFHHSTHYLHPPSGNKSLSTSPNTIKPSFLNHHSHHHLLNNHNSSASTNNIPTATYEDDDLDSLNSYASITSTTSCEHPFVAHNGTTFSGRKMKYVVHCSNYAGQTGDEYLTPTQRAQKQIRRLKVMLQQAKQDIEQKDSDIFRLTKEVVELRVYKATLSSPEDKSNSSEAVTVRENPTDDMKTPDSPTCITDFTDDPKIPYEKSICSGIDMASSFADSGHFEDLNLNQSKDSVIVQMFDKAVMVRLEEDQQRIVELYEKKFEDMIREHGSETNELKQKHHEKIEELLQKLSDVNLRYCQLVPNYEQAKEKIQELEKQLDDVNKQLQEQEEKNKQLYLQMYNKGIEAAKLEQKEQVLALAQQSPSRVSVSELLQQLQVTQNELDNIKETDFMAEQVHAQSLLSAKEAVSLWVLGARKAMYRRLVELKNSRSEMDPEITLQFLKSAIYYFLTDKENHQGHLRAIQSILGFSPSEISNIDKARTS